MRKIALILAAAVLLAAALTACARRRNEPEADAAQTTQDEPKPEEEGQNGGTGAAQTEAAELSFASFDGGGPEYSVEIGDTDLISCERGVFYAKPDHDSMPAASAFFEDNGGFEKVCELPWSLPESSEELTVGPGDVVLYQGDKLCVYYGENTWSLTPVAKIEGVTREELLDAFGDEADARLELVWLD